MTVSSRHYDNQSQENALLNKVQGLQTSVVKILLMIFYISYEFLRKKKLPLSFLGSEMLS